MSPKKKYPRPAGRGYEVHKKLLRSIGELVFDVTDALLHFAFCLIGLAIVYRMRTMRSMMIVQVLGFSLMFLSIGQVPIRFLDSWLHTAARVNPLTNVLREDQPGKSLSHEAAMRNAPQTANGLFIVPKIVE